MGREEKGVGDGWAEFKNFRGESCKAANERQRIAIRVLSPPLQEPLLHGKAARFTATIYLTNTCCNLDQYHNPLKFMLLKYIKQEILFLHRFPSNLAHVNLLARLHRRAPQPRLGSLI